MLRCLGFNTTVPEYCQKNPTLDDSYYLQSPDQMKRLIAAYPSEAIENTRRIADMCNVEQISRPIGRPCRLNAIGGIGRTLAFTLRRIRRR